MWVGENALVQRVYHLQDYDLENEATVTEM